MDQVDRQFDGQSTCVARRNDTTTFGRETDMIPRLRPASFALPISEIQFIIGTSTADDFSEFSDLC